VLCCCVVMRANKANNPLPVVGRRIICLTVTPMPILLLRRLDVIRRKTMTTPKIDTQKRSFFQDRKMWFWIAAGSGLVTLIVLVIFLQALISTTKYYVLNQDVEARTPISAEMLVEQVVSSGGEPQNAFGIDKVNEAAMSGEPLYTKTALKAGDILTASNAGDLIPLRQGIPKDFVVASFSADPNNSAGGNIKRGDYVDVFYAQDGQASLLFQRLMILDATIDLNSGAPAESTDPAAAGTAPTTTQDTATAAYRGGIPFLYTVGVTQADALKLAATSGGKFFVVLTSEENATAKDVAPKTLGMSLNDALQSAAGDSGKGTDSSFGEKKEESAATPSASPSAAPTQSSTPSPTQSAEVQLETDN
jgi:Flp pilus assembly protein CpaB